jgi:hypothetical protein
MSEINSLQSDAAAFVNPEHRIGAIEQLEFAHRVRGLFGQNADTDNIPQSGMLSMIERVQQYPHLRLNPTRLDGVYNRRANATPNDRSELADILPKDLLFIDETNLFAALWTKTGGPALYNGRLFESSQEEQKAHDPDKMKKYDLRYLNPDGEFVRYPEYVGALLATGQALQRSRSGYSWTYPLMNMSNRPPRRGETGSVDTLHSQTHPVISPEALINLQLIHIIAGKPLHDDIVDIANEAVCEVDETGGVVKMIGAVGITNHRNEHTRELEFIRHAWWRSSPTKSDFQAVEGLSAIGRPSIPPRRT